MTDMIATNPVTAPAVPSIVYDKWYLTQLTGKFDVKNGRTIVTLNRANLTNGQWTLMPTSEKASEVSFTLDLYKEMQNTPELASAFQSVLAAVTAYATKKSLL